jgi:DNA (cytosine-5)-methyltransferase 1
MEQRERGAVKGAYYNENDSFSAGWLRTLIRRGLIAAGDVDQRSLVNVRARELVGYSQHHFFAGIGGWSLALRLAGWPDDRSVWTGSCPCQPFSLIGERAAADDRRHLWPAWFPLVAELRPPILFGEQTEAAVGWGWLDVVFADLEAAGYACGASVLPACSVGAPHLRDRLWFVAKALALGDAECARLERHERDGDSRDQPGWLETNSSRPASAPSGVGFWSDAEWLECLDGEARPVEPGTFPLAHGISGRVGRLRSYGNAIVAQLAAQFIRASS